MSNAIEGLKPELVWKYFAEISKIPRGSKNEKRDFGIYRPNGKKPGA